MSSEDEELRGRARVFWRGVAAEEQAFGSTSRFWRLLGSRASSASRSTGRRFLELRGRTSGSEVLHTLQSDESRRRRLAFSLVSFSSDESQFCELYSFRLT